MAAEQNLDRKPPPRILVVDDEPDLEELVKQRFRRRMRSGDISFVFARDGEQALDMLTQGSDIDMVLSDINMPRMDGLTLLGKLKELDVDARSVIVSAYGDMANIRTAMNLGAFDFLTKPIEFDDLEITVEKTLKDIAKLRDAQRQKQAEERAKQALARYFSPSIASQLANDPDAIRTGGDRRIVTLLFTDLADFTPLVETSDPKLLVPLLNSYLGGLTQCVFEHEGAVFKIIGDSVRAMFGAPLSQPDSADRALACARAIDQFAEGFRQEWRAKGVPVSVTRIGVNTGAAIVGNFGGAGFFDYSAYGDAINIAARLEAANKTLGTRICVSQSTVDASRSFVGRPVGELLLKGKSRALPAYEPAADGEANTAAVKAYTAAYELMQLGDDDAAQAFAAHVGAHGADPLATFHLRRLLDGQNGPFIDLAD